MGKVIGRNGSVAKAHAHPAEGRRGARGHADLAGDRLTEAAGDERPQLRPATRGSRSGSSVASTACAARSASRSSPTTRLASTLGSVLFLEGDERPLTVAWTGADEPGLLVRFRELPDARVGRGPARPLSRGACPERRCPPTTWYWHELMGLAVVTTEGEELGRVADVFRAGGGEVSSSTAVRAARCSCRGRRTSSSSSRRGRGRLVVDADALGLDAGAALARRGRRTTRARKAAELARARPRRDASAEPPGLMLRIDVITLFPGMFPGRSGESIPGRALERGLASSGPRPARRGASAGIGRVDDYPYGGGAGHGPAARARRGGAGRGRTRWAPARLASCSIPVASRFDQARARTSRHGSTSCSSVRATRAWTTASGRSSTSSSRSATTCCRAARCRRWWSSMPCCGCCRAPSTRASPEEESFAARAARVPAVHAPAEFRDMRVPDILLSGHHGEVDALAPRAGAGAHAPGPTGPAAAGA